MKYEPRTPHASAENKQRLYFADFDDSSVELIINFVTNKRWHCEEKTITWSKKITLLIFHTRLIVPTFLMKRFKAKSFNFPLLLNHISVYEEACEQMFKSYVTSKLILNIRNVFWNILLFHNDRAINNV